MPVRERLFVALTAVFVTALLVADLTGGKFFRLALFQVGSYEFVTHSVGMLSFPITFLLTDFINDFYGKRAARLVTAIGLGCAALAFVLVYVGRKIPVAGFSPISQEDFDAVFAMSNRLYIASLTAYVVGQLADIWLFGVIKRRTQGRLVWLRATGSTVVSQALDSLLVTYILFAGVVDAKGGTLDAAAILEIAATGYILKFVLALVLTPVLYLGRWLIRTRLGVQPLPPETVDVAMT